MLHLFSIRIIFLGYNELKYTFKEDLGMFKTLKGFIWGVIGLAMVAITYGWYRMLNDKEWTEDYRKAIKG